VVGGVGPDGSELGHPGGTSFAGAPTFTSAPWLGASRVGQTVERPLYGISGVLTVPCGNGNLDLDDYRNFEACLLGPGGGLGAGCECFDFDSDGDVDLKDFAAFQEAFTG
jgi:hypothetical protein